MAVNKKLLQGAATAAGGLTPSEHFGVVTYTGDGSSSNKVGDGSFTVLGLPDTGTAFPYLVSEKVYSSGKYYFEINDLANGNTGAMQCMVGIVPTSFRGDMTYPWKTGNGGLFWYQSNGQLYNNGSGSGSFGTFAAGDDVAIAVDFDNNTMTLYKNGSQSGSQISGVPSGTYHMSVSTGYNQYKGKAALKETLMQYSIPSGYEAWGGDIDTSGDWSNYSEYDGVLDFQPDFIWFKTRTQAYDHNITDSTRGTGKQVRPNRTIAEVSATDLITSFDTGGFTVGSGGDANKSGDDYVAWCLKANGGTTSSNTDGSITTTVQANQDSGFSIIKYDMNVTSATAFTIGHGLSAAPELVFFFSLDQSGSTSNIVYPNNPNKEMVLDNIGAASSSSAYWNNTAPSSTVINMGTAWGQYYSYYGGDTIAYAFHSVDGFSKIGSYTGNGSDNGPIVETGFEPAFVMIKRSSGTGNWQIWDNKRSTTNTRDKLLFPNDSAAEQTLAYVDFLSNGFQVVDASGATGGTNVNISGSTYIYMAFAADPDTEAPTVAKSFSTVTYTGTGAAQSITGLGFKPSLLWLKNTDTAENHFLVDSVRGASELLFPNITNAETTATGGGVASFDSDGFSLQAPPPNYGINLSNLPLVAWAWKADDNEPTIFGGPAKAVYKFEDNANDVTGNYNGTASNVTYTSSGKFNKAADFNGTNSYVQTSLTTNLTSFSWSCWIKPDVAWSGDVTTIVKGFYSGASNTNYQYLGYTGGDFRFQFRDNTSTAHVSSSVTPAVGQWSHIVATVDGGTSIKIYVNGVLTGSGTNSRTISNTNPVSIGGAASIFGPFDGQIDQVRIYQGAIAQEQVTELYNETASDNDDLTLGAPPKSIVSANANAGFSIVKWTANGNSALIPHGLSSAPEFIIMKNISSGTSSDDWVVGNSSSGWTKAMHLNLTNADNASDFYWNDTSPTATVFSVGAGAGVYQRNGDDFIAYCFHSVSGFSKIGTFTGTGTGTNQLINTGFQPDWVMFKDYSAGGSWWMQDSVRGSSKSVKANASDAESTTNYVTFESNGFRVSGDANGTSDWIYMAFKIN